MIINLRGNHASGKSTVVRKVLAQLDGRRPIFGMLGPTYPEAYACEFHGRPVYVLGPYRDQAHGGCDVVTKKGVEAAVGLFERYRTKGTILFESILTSVRFGAPGEWLLKHKPEVLVAILDVPLETCFESLHARQDASEFFGGEKHMRAQQRQFENVQRRLKELGFRMEYVNRDNAAAKILSWLS